MNIYLLYNALAKKIHTFITAPRCTGCSILLTEKAIFCEECHQKIVPVISTQLSVTQHYTVNVFAGGAYHNALKRLILAKHSGNQLAGNQLGTIIWHTTPLPTLPIDYIVPIPLHWTRRLYRGFNQTENMAETLSELSGKPVAYLLKRTKKTVFQAKLSAHDRKNNMQDAFALIAKQPDVYLGKHLILVDDLFTTGTTLTQACKLLAKLKPASITCVVGARVT